MKTYKVKITEGSGREWWDNDVWVDPPDQEDAIREYNDGCMVEVWGPDSDPDYDDYLYYFEI